MRELRLVAVDEHGSHLILGDGDGGDHASARLPIDDRLRQAVQASTPATPTTEPTPQSQVRSTSALSAHSTPTGEAMSASASDSTPATPLSPREIQARVRSGSSVEDLCADSGMSHERVMRYAAPVLAEREHIIGRARRAHLRRLPADTTGSSTDSTPIPLDDAVSGYVAAERGDTVAPADVTWNSWRRDDGRWLVSATWGEQVAQFAFEPSGRSVGAENQTARWVAGEPLPEPEPEPEVEPAGPARLSVVPHTELADDPDLDPTDEAFWSSPVAPPDSEDDTPGKRPPIGLAPVPSEPEVDSPAPASVQPIAPAVQSESPDQPEGEPTGRAQDPPAGRRARRHQQRYGRGDRRRRDPDLLTSTPRGYGSTGHDLDDPAEQVTSERLHLDDIASQVETTTPESGQSSPSSASSTSKSSERSRRPSVPSWDEIMFGRRDRSE
ncbi:MAG TPA: septation protein SepH [Jiangellaceae bacterium]|nr:septation protein SepH [Jiangellaceae bacterium]